MKNPKGLRCSNETSYRDAYRTRIRTQLGGLQRSGLSTVTKEPPPINFTKVNKIRIQLEADTPPPQFSISSPKIEDPTVLKNYIIVRYKYSEFLELHSLSIYIQCPIF